MMNIKPIKNETDYDLALSRVDALMNAKSGSPEGDELDILVTLVEKYEAQFYPIDTPNPIEAIRFRMDQFDLKDKDLIPYIGQSGRVSEILGFKRKLTLTMIRNLHTGLQIPTESLIQDYELKNG